MPAHWRERCNTGFLKIDSHSIFLFQLPNPLLQELPLWFLLGQRQSFLIRGPRLSRPTRGELGTGRTFTNLHSFEKPGNARSVPDFCSIVVPRMSAIERTRKFISLLYLL